MHQTRNSSSANPGTISNHITSLTENNGWDLPQETITAAGLGCGTDSATRKGLATDCDNISFQHVRMAFEWLSQNFKHQPSLTEAATAANIRVDQLQCYLAQITGVSPEQMIPGLTFSHTQRLLARFGARLDAACQEDLPGCGHLHDRSVTIEALSPGEYKRQGEGLQLRYGFHPSPFGECVLVESDRGIYGLGFVGAMSRQNVLEWLCHRLQQAHFVHDDEATADTVRLAFKASVYEPRPGLRLLVCGTAFQVKVWEALLRIPPGYVASYADIASLIGDPQAIRAVGAANSHNTIAWLIPCHRVIRNNGTLGGYRWGPGSKLAMLTSETCTTPS